MVLGATGVGLALTALFLLSRTTQNSEDFDRLHGLLLLINVAGVLVLFAFLIGNLARLWRDYRNHVPGSKLKARMVGMSVTLAVVPLLVVFYFSMQFINRGIDTWFNVEIEKGLDDALALSRAALEMQMRDHLSTTLQIADRLREVSGRQLFFELSMLRRESGASEITVFGTNRRILATSSDLAAGTMPTLLKDEVILQIRQNRPFVSLDPLERGSYQIRTAVAFGDRSRPQSVGLIQAQFPVTERIGRMANNVDLSYSKYKRLVYLRDPLKRNFTFTLTVVLLLSLLSSVYGAFVLSRRLVAPIQNLVAGTRAVAKGNFDTRLPTPSRDEIGFLVSSFNDMTEKLSGRGRTSESRSYSRKAVYRGRCPRVRLPNPNGESGVGCDSKRRSGKQNGRTPHRGRQRPPAVTTIRRCCPGSPRCRGNRVERADRVARRGRETRAYLRLHDTPGRRGSRRGIRGRIR